MGYLMKHFKLCLITFFFLLSVPACSNEITGEPEKVRPSALAGRWYPADADSLRKEVDNYLATASRETYPKQRLFALISPHAGYTYSGLAAAYGYNHLREQNIHRIVILAPSHYASYKGVSIPDVTHYETPLGKVSVDRAMVKKLWRNPLFSTVPEAHTQEHSLEIQLPMLQRVMGDFSLVPMVLGQVEKEEFKEIAHAIRPFLDEKTLVIVSSDFTHHGPRFDYVPLKNGLKTGLRKLDGGAVERIIAKDFEGFWEYKQNTGATICGFVPIAVLLNLLPGNVQGRMLHYYTSGDLTGDFQNSVSYVSLAFYEGGIGGVRREKAEDILSGSGPLNEREQKNLLTISRKVLDEVINTRQYPVISPQHYDFTPRLMADRGVFVTLKKHEELRGCIGSIIGRGPLFLSTIRNTVNSAVRDYRFPPVSKEELSSIDIEISVLTPPEQISGARDFIVGKHGIILKKDGKQAVFLPQVATEQGWNREKTLTQLALKAGLPDNAWKEGARFYVFEAQVFGEK